MRHVFRSAAALGAIAALALGATACSGSGDAADEKSDDGVQKLVVATSGEPRPNTYVDENDEVTGYDIEILKKIDEKLDDVEFEFELTDFASLFAGLDSGRYNIVANNVSATEERKEKYDFSDPYIEAQFGVVLPKDSDVKKVDSFEDLAGKKAYGQSGLNFTKVLEAYNEQNPDKKVEIEYTEADLQTQYNNLATGQVDFAFNELVVFNNYGKKDGLDLEFQPLDGDYLTENFGTNLLSAYAFSRQTENGDHVLEEVNTALAELKEDGTLAELSEKYFDGVDLSPKSE